MEILSVLRTMGTTGDLKWYDAAGRYLEAYFNMPNNKQGYSTMTVEADGITPTGWFNPGTRSRKHRMLGLPRDYFTGGVRPPESDEVLQEIAAFMCKSDGEKLAAIDACLASLPAPLTAMAEADVKARYNLNG